MSQKENERSAVLSRPRTTGRRGSGPRKLVLSRKGFDSGYGGMPSPILPDGRLVPLPIPSRHDARTLAELNTHGLDLAPLLADLSKGVHALDTRVHLDPDLDRAPHLRMPGWRPALGQTGAAQSHLCAQGVGAGDVFLFFGWFRQVERATGRWRFARSAPNLHVLFGWLEVGELLPIVEQRAECLTRHDWIADHPHVANPTHYTDKRNTLYIAPSRSAYVPDRLGGGLFPQLTASLQLTAKSSKTRSVWSLPSWFHPTEDTSPLSYHADLSRWTDDGDRCGLKAVAKGQEFVLDLSGRKQATEWIRRLVSDHKSLCADNDDCQSE